MTQSVLRGIRRAQLACFVVALAGPMPSRGIELDPTRVSRLAVGKPGGAAPAERCDGQRSGRATTPLPVPPVLLASARAPGALAHDPVVDDAGRMVIVTPAGRVVQLTKAGRQDWVQQLGSPPAGPPVLSTGGDRILVGAEQRLVRFASDGRRVLGIRLPYALAERMPAPLPMFDDGVLLAHPDRLVWYGRDGNLRAEGDVHGTTEVLLQEADRVIAVMSGGRVLSWRPGAPPHIVGDLRGHVGGAASLAGTRLVAVIDGRELRQMDLRSGRVTTLVARSALRLTPALVVLDEVTVVTTTNGLALGIDARGREAFRVALWTQGPTVAPTTGHVPLLGDSAGNLVFATPAGAVTVATPRKDGQPQPARGCVDPLALVPLGPQAFALACRSGLISYFGAQSHSRQDRRNRQ